MELIMALLNKASDLHKFVEKLVPLELIEGSMQVRIVHEYKDSWKELEALGCGGRGGGAACANSSSPGKK